MLEKSFGLLFFLKTGSSPSQEKKHVYLRITVDGISKELSLKRLWRMSRWNQGIGRASGNHEDARVLNEFLEAVTSKIYRFRTELFSADIPLTASRIKDMLTGKNTKKRTILGEFEKHNLQMKTLVGSEFALATYLRYRTALAHVRSFLSWKYDLEDVELRSLGFEFISDFEFYLKSEKKCGHNSAMKYLANFKKIINNCILKGYLGKDPFTGFKMRIRDTLRFPLTIGEIMLLQQKTFSDTRLEKVRDIFLFSCYTGLAYIDVKKLTKSEIVEVSPLEKYISTVRQKTGSHTRIPLLIPAIRLLEKYAFHPLIQDSEKVLPVISNQRINAYLKEIAKLCGIGKRLTFHLARHTFATTVTLSNGVPLYTVSKMLGHSSIQQTEHYARLSNEQVSEDMRNLSHRLTGIVLN